MKRASSAALVRGYFDRKKDRCAGFSLGMLARQMNCSVSNLSRIFSGKRKLQFDQLEAFARPLEIDEMGKQEIRTQMLRERLGSDFDALREIPQSLVDGESIDLASRRSYFLLEKWYYLAILELATCRGFVFDAEWVAKKLGIARGVAAAALERLVNTECLVEKAGRWIKNSEKIRFPDGKERRLHNTYQKENFRRSLQALELIDEKSLAERLVVGGTVAVNSANMEKARAILNRAAMEAMQLLCEGECDQVFQLSMALVPLTKPRT